MNYTLYQYQGAFDEIPSTHENYPLDNVDHYFMFTHGGSLHGELAHRRTA